MTGSCSWMPYACQGVKGFDDDDIFHTHDMKACRGSRRRAPLILNLGIRWA